MTTLCLYNSLTDRKEPFLPPDTGKVGLYCCGPTVYDVPHLGHARTCVFFDSLVRVLRHVLHYGVCAVMNVTDLDDKIVERGGPRIAREFEARYFETMDALNVERPDFAPRVTDYLQSAWRVAEACLAKGFAYRGRSTGNVYFDTGAYLRRRSRVFGDTRRRDETTSPSSSSSQGDKKDSRDFAIWKRGKNWIDFSGLQHHEMPGWHTECACVKISHFGNPVDILVGGTDLKFPHHENAITLGRIFYDTEPWVRFCLHTGHLEIEGQKMSKSLKNFTTVDEVIAKGYSRIALRYLFLKHPYGAPMSFSEEDLRSAQKSYDQFLYHMDEIRQYILLRGGYNTPRYCDIPLREKIRDALLDNLNIPLALRYLEEFVRREDIKNLSPSELANTFAYVVSVAHDYFGILPKTMSRERSNDLARLFQSFRTRVMEHASNRKDITLWDIGEEFREKAKNVGYVIEGDLVWRIRSFRTRVREHALNEKDYVLLKMCDEIRQEMKKMHYVIEDDKKRE